MPRERHAVVCFAHGYSQAQVGKALEQQWLKPPLAAARPHDS